MSRPAPKKARKKKLEIEQNTMLSSKAKKKIKWFFSGLFGRRA
jgi:hypothetical protein